MPIKLPKILPKEITDKYDVVRNSFVIKDKGDISEEREIEIGDVKQDEFSPILKLKQWSNETNLSVRLIDDEPDKPQIKTEGKKIKFIKNKIEAHFYDVPKTGEMPDCFEFDIILKEKPASNIQTLEMQTKGLKFYYQPPLTEEITEEEKAKGWTATETDIKDEKGNVVCHRPENVVGSYAVYHESKTNHILYPIDKNKYTQEELNQMVLDKTHIGKINNKTDKVDYFKLGKNYRAGKAFHWYRVKAWDKTGKEVWCKLNVDVSKGVRTVEIPQDFLDNAVYPVIIDDTFGYTNIGPTETSWAKDRVAGTLGTSGASAGTADSVSLYTRTGSGTFKGGLYEGTTLIAEGGDSVASESNDWTVMALSSETIDASTAYYICWGGSGENFLNYDSCTDCAAYTDLISNVEQNPWPNPTITWITTVYDFKFSIYCTYTAGAADLTSSVSDQLNLTEDISTENTALGGISKSDQLNLTEDISITIFPPDLAISVNDDVSISEDITPEITSFVNVSDSLTIIESITAQNTELGGINVSDNISITENIGITKVLILSVSDNITLTESVSLVNTQLGNIDVNDSVSITELVAVGRNLFISVDDDITITENIAITNTQLSGVNVNDNVSITENVVITNIQLGNINISDQLNITEDITIEVEGVALNISVNDNISLTESVSLTNTQLGGISVSDQLTINEDASVSISLADLTLSLNQMVRGVHIF